MVEVKFYDSIDDKFLKFAVIISTEASGNGCWKFSMKAKVENYGVFRKHMFEQPRQFSEKTIAGKIVKIERAYVESQNQVRKSFIKIYEKNKYFREI